MCVCGWVRGGAEMYVSHTALICACKSLTKNSNVKVLQVFSYLWVDLKTTREVNWNDLNFTTVLLLCGGKEAGEEGGGNAKLLPMNSLISSPTLCSLS